MFDIQTAIPFEQFMARALHDPQFLDGVGGTNAQAGFIPNADLTVDTGDSVYFGNATNGYRALRNTLMHEIGHAFGQRSCGAWRLARRRHALVDLEQVDLRPRQRQRGEGAEQHVEAFLENDAPNE